MKEEKISVIVPIYNIEQEIARCLMTLIHQDYTNYEIILIDDGSTDKSAEIIDILSDKSNNIKIFHTENNGLSSARNFGISKATGKYIVFVDGDDYVEPNFLSSLYNSIKKYGSDISVCGYSTITRRKIIDSIPNECVMTGEEATIKLLTRQDNMEIVSWNKMYRKDLFDDIFFPADRNFEDNLTTYKLFAKAKKVSYIKTAIYDHVIRGGSIMDLAKTVHRLSAKIDAANDAIALLGYNPILKEAAEYSLLLAYFQMIDHASRKEIPNKYFNKYAKKVLAKKQQFLDNRFCDKKRRSYIMAISFASGSFYKTFRRF